MVSESYQGTIIFLNIGFSFKSHHETVYITGTFFKMETDRFYRFIQIKAREESCNLPLFYFIPQYMEIIS